MRKIYNNLLAIKNYDNNSESNNNVNIFGFEDSEDRRQNGL